MAGHPGDAADVKDLTPKQQAEYEAWWKVFRTYFSPEDAISATRRYVESGYGSYWKVRPRQVTSG